MTVECPGCGGFDVSGVAKSVGEVVLEPMMGRLLRSDRVVSVSVLASWLCRGCGESWRARWRPKNVAEPKQHVAQECDTLASKAGTA